MACIRLSDVHAHHCLARRPSSLDGGQSDGSETFYTEYKLSVRICPMDQQHVVGIRVLKKMKNLENGIRSCTDDITVTNAL